MNFEKLLCLVAFLDATQKELKVMSCANLISDQFSRCNSERIESFLGEYALLLEVCQDATQKELKGRENQHPKGQASMDATQKELKANVSSSIFSIDISV